MGSLIPVHAQKRKEAFLEPDRGCVEDPPQPSKIASALRLVADVTAAVRSVSRRQLSRIDAVERTPHPGLLPFGRGEGAAFRHSVPTYHPVTRPSAGIDLPSPHPMGGDFPEIEFRALNPRTRLWPLPGGEPRFARQLQVPLLEGV